MQNQPKILKQRKQSLNKYHQNATITLGTSTNIASSMIREKQSMSNSKARSSSTLPKGYSNGLGTEIGVERGMGVCGRGSQKGEAPRSYGLMGWGMLPIRNSKTEKQQSVSKCYSQSTYKIADKISKFSVGQHHIVYINNKYQAFGIGSSIFGQLGYHQPVDDHQMTGFTEGSQYNSMPIPILEELLVQEVFCTPFCTFLVTNRDQVYACGLNNRGQLGIEEQNAEQESTIEKSITTPVKVMSLSKKPLLLTQNSNHNKSHLQNSKKQKVTRIQSYALAQKNLHNNHQQPKQLLTQKSEGANSDIYLNTNTNTNTINLQTYISGSEGQNGMQNESILEDGEFIVDITGGPYHTLALSNKGKAFYSGNIYKKSSILNNEYTTKFAQLNLKKIGKVRKIKSGITSIGLLNAQGSLFLLGAINEGIICDEPYNVNMGISGIVDFAFGRDRVYGVNAMGEVWGLVGAKRSLKSYRVAVGGKIRALEAALDYCVLEGQKGEIYGVGEAFLELFPNAQLINNKDPGSKTSSSDYLDEPVYKLSSNAQMASLKAGIGFAVGLMDKPLTNQIRVNLNNLKQTKANDQNQQNLMNRINQLQKQNRILKQLIKDQNSQAKTQRNISARKKQLTSSTNLGSVVKKTSNCENGSTNSKFDLNVNVSQKIVSKARKFDNSMEIPFEELQLGKQISEGGYGVIYKAVWRKTTVAVKIFKIDLNSQNSVKDFVSECHAMQALRHPNIVMFLGACTKPPNFAIVLEYCQGGTLWSILQKSGELSWQLRRRLALDTARGMNYLHERSTPILHRDLKSLNLLLDDNKRIKLADFGWTKGLQNYMTGKIGTYQWMAPQVVSSHQYTEKADIFSFGIILWQIASRQAPYRNIPGVQVAQDVLNKDLRPVVPKKTPEQFAALMKRCWAKVPEQRPSFSEIIQELEKMELPA